MASYHDASVINELLPPACGQSLVGVGAKPLSHPAPGQKVGASVSQIPPPGNVHN